MNLSDRLPDWAVLAQRGFERLAQAKGDITKPVIEHYYATHPEARASFAHHGMDNVPELEGRMVAETAFLLMHWAGNPAAAKLEQATTICHHQDALEIGPHWYIGLIDAVLAILFETIPQGADEERKMWLDVRGEITRLIESVREEFVRKDMAGELPAFDPRAVFTPVSGLVS